MKLEIKSLSKCFCSRTKSMQALNNVNLTVQEGEIVCVLGHNGAGKTTLIKLICGLMKPDEGYVKIDGKTVHKNLAYAHRKCGTVLEGSRNIYYYLTAHENLQYFGLLNGLQQTRIDELANRYLKMFDLEAFRNVPSSSLSRGMQQKIAIIIALMKDPDILLLDEPTLGLDILSSDSVIQILKQLVADEHRTILITTHDIHLIEELNCRLIFMNHGQIIQDSLLSALRQGENIPFYKLTVIGIEKLPEDAVVEKKQENITIFRTSDYGWIQNKLKMPQMIQIEKCNQSVTDIYKGIMTNE